MHEGAPVKESGKLGSKEVAIPFNSEYGIRLKNKNNQACSARVFIDGRKISSLGDFIIQPGGRIVLERFVDRSLEKGNRFKFVSLDNSHVDDPTSSDNGIVRVEFRLAKDTDSYVLTPSNKFDNSKLREFYTDVNRWYYEDNSGPSLKSKGFVGESNGSSFIGYSNSCFGNNTSAGATVDGKVSTQKFTYSDLEVEDKCTVLQLKIVGINSDIKRHIVKKYCNNCGNKLRPKDKFCSGCGKRTR